MAPELPRDRLARIRSQQQGDQLTQRSTMSERAPELPSAELRALAEAAIKTWDAVPIRGSCEDVLWRTVIALATAGDGLVAALRESSDALATAEVARDDQAERLASATQLARALHERLDELEAAEVARDEALRVVAVARRAAGWIECICDDGPGCPPDDECQGCAMRTELRDALAALDAGAATEEPSAV